MKVSARSRAFSKHVVCADVSRGREKFEIRAFNDVDDAPAPMDFVYVTTHVSGVGVTISNNPSLLTCCTCEDNCKDASKCECAQRTGGFAYGRTGVLLSEKPAIYECNLRCRCHVSRCKNRVVGRGPQLRLEVFRCDDPNKGWGLRCLDNIPAGTYVADYLGEVLREADAENRGLAAGDEYLFHLDFCSRSQACSKLSEVGMNQGSRSIFRQEYMDVGAMSKNDLSAILGDGMVALLDAKGAIKRVRKLGKDRDMEIDLVGDGTPNSSSSAAEEMASSKKLVHGNERSSNSSNNSSSSDSNSSNNSSNNNSNSSSGNSSSSGGSSSISKSSNNSNISSSSSSSNSSGSSSSSSSSPEVGPRVSGNPWSRRHREQRQQEWTNAVAIVTDRTLTESEHAHSTFTVDARSFGSVARFLNHSCEPNLDIVTVFVESHDVRMPRVAFFTAEDVPKMTELCYDYGYFEGNVDGKHRKCLCGAVGCRKRMY